MTTSELTERYLSDVRAAHAAHERGFFGDAELDEIIERLDNQFFGDLNFMQTFVGSRPELQPAHS